MHRSFTLIEIMIALAIVTVISAVAIPEFRVMQLRAKRAESAVNVRGIKVSQYALEASTDAFALGLNNPGTSLTKSPRPFDSSIAGWSTLDWTPDGEVRCNYMTTPLPSSDTDDFRVTARCDIDGDGNVYQGRLFAARFGSEIGGRWERSTSDIF